MMKKIRINQLIIEVTRRCNLQCAHCLRGDRQDLDSTVPPEQILKGIVEIGDISFTGGEPTLNSGYVKRIVDYIIDNQIHVEGAYMPTNGLIYSAEIVEQFRRLLIHKFRNTGIEKYPKWIQEELENGTWSIPVSEDIYHKQPDLDTLIRWITCGFYSRDKVIDFSKTPVILEGRAADSELDGRECPHNYNLEMDVYDDYVEVEMIYVNCKGDILTDCDTSYANQAKHSIGNILHGISLADFLLTYSKEEQKEAV